MQLCWVSYLRLTNGLRQLEEHFFDTVYRVESPEGIVLELHPAGPFVRLIAWLIDFGVRAILIFVLVFAGELLGQLGWGLFLIGFFVINWFYPVFFELFGNGATPGKRVFGLQVIKQNGTPVDLAASLVRNLLRTADYLPFFFGVGLVSMLSNRGFRRLGDLAAGTLVVVILAPTSSWPSGSAISVAGAS